MITYDDVKPLRDAGLCVLPTHFGEKRPAMASWTEYQDRLPADRELQNWFRPEANREGMGIVCGDISGGLEVIDFDQQAAEFENWKKEIPDELFRLLVIERSYSGGKHVFYRCEQISGGQKLAMSEDKKTLIETRGEHNFIKCAPSEKYELEQGELVNIPTVTIEQREVMLMAARNCNQLKEEKQNIPPTSERTSARQNGTLRPGDDYNQRGNIRELLEAEGWKYSYTTPDGKERWTRPGKKKGVSGDLKIMEDGAQVFFVFTSSTQFEQNKAYTPYQMYTLLKCNGDYKEAARQLRAKGYGEQKQQRRETIEVNDVEIDVNEIRSNPNLRSPENFNEFPLDALPNVARAFILDQARAKNQNPAGIASIYLAQMGGHLGGAVRLRLNNDNWLAPPVLWVCLIGVSGFGKSPAMDAVRELAEAKSEWYHNEFKKNLVDYNFRLNQWKKANRKGGTEPEPTAPTERKIFVTDATFEGLIKDVAISGGRTLLIFDEICSLFEMMNKNKTPGESSKWLSGYNGGSVSTSRANARETYINKAYWGVYGGTTPERFRNQVKADGGDKDGFLSRFLLVFPPRVTQYIKPTEKMMEDVAKHRRDATDVCETLIDLDLGEDPDAEENIYGNVPRKKFVELHLCADAQAEWEKLKEENFNLINSPANANDVTAGFLSKSLELSARIAIIIHSIEAAYQYNTGAPITTKTSEITGLPVEQVEPFTIPPEISLQTWERARTIADWFITENIVCYEQLNFVQSKSNKGASIDVLETIGEAVGGLSARDIAQKIRRFRTQKGRRILDGILQYLQDSNSIHSEEEKAQNGKMVRKYFINE